MPLNFVRDFGNQNTYQLLDEYVLLERYGTELLPKVKVTYEFKNSRCSKIQEYAYFGKTQPKVAYQWDRAYNAMGLLTTIVRRELPVDGYQPDGYSSDSTTYIYTGDGMIETQIDYTPKSVSQINGDIEWERLYKTCYTYTLSGKVSKVNYYKWNGNIWEASNPFGSSSSNSSNYEYDLNDNLILYQTIHDPYPVLIEYKDGFPSRIYKKDENDSLRGSVEFEFTDLPTSIDNEVSLKKSSFSFHNGVAKLESAGQASPLKLYTLAGKQVAEINPSRNENGYQFDLRTIGISEGIYIAKTTTDQALVKSKIMIR